MHLGSMSSPLLTILGFGDNQSLKGQCTYFLPKLICIPGTGKGIFFTCPCCHPRITSVIHASPEFGDHHKTIRKKNDQGVWGELWRPARIYCRNTNLQVNAVVPGASPGCSCLKASSPCVYLLAVALTSRITGFPRISVGFGSNL